MRRLTCPHCNKFFRNDRTRAGTFVGCPHCRMDIRIPRDPAAVYAEVDYRDASDRKTVVVFAIFVIAAMMAYPPWLNKVTHEQRMRGMISADVPQVSYVPIGYGWLFNPPPGRDVINWQRLCAQWLLTVLVAAGVCVYYTDWKSRPQKKLEPPAIP